MGKKFKCKSEEQKRAIRISYAIRSKQSDNEVVNVEPKQKKYVGKVFRGKTKYIDPETKEERNYVVVAEDNRGVSVSKLKSIKKIDENGKNADKALQEINYQNYGLEKRTGVDFEVLRRNRMSGRPLQIEDKAVFPEDQERFKLSSHDLSRVLVHTRQALRKKKKR